MRHRIFIAINLPERVKKELSKFQSRFSELPARWTKPENLHITLAFLGYLSDNEIAKICKITEEVASRNQPFLINLNQICYGPKNKKPPRMVWAVGEKTEELTKLKNDLDSALSDDLRYKKENRPYAPHITLARIRKWDFKKIDPEDRPQIETNTSLSFNVSSIEVMESVLKRGGAEYAVLLSAPLSYM
jgi:2'-5' RNA ligase